MHVGGGIVWGGDCTPCTLCPFHVASLPGGLPGGLGTLAPHPVPYTPCPLPPLQVGSALSPHTLHPVPYTLCPCPLSPLQVGSALMEMLLQIAKVPGTSLPALTLDNEVSANRGVGPPKWVGVMAMDSGLAKACIQGTVVSHTAATVVMALVTQLPRPASITRW